MSKRSRLDVKGTDDFINQYREEIAQEFGIFHTVTQTEHQANISSATRKVLEKQRKRRKNDEK